MAKRTVGDWGGEGKREAGAAELDEALSALSKSMAALAKELAARLMESGSSAPRVDGLVREAVLEAGRRGLEEAAEGDRSDCGAANAPQCCRGRMRYAGRERSATETALGRVRLAMGRYVCLSCGKSARPRASRLDVEGSMTPTARRMASELGSARCHGEADRLLNVVAGVNFGTKRVERTTRLVGDDLERWRTEWLSGSITVVGGAPVRRPLKEGRILCVGLDGTGIPALPSETAGRKGKDGRATTREAKVGAVWVAEPDGEGGTRPAPGSTRHFAAVESAEDDAKGDSPAWRWGTARTGFGGCTGRGSRTRSASWTSSTPRSTCGRRRGPPGDDAKAAKRWAEKLCRLLEAGRMDDVLAALRRPGAGSEERAKAVRCLSEWRGRMRYAEYRSRGLPIGSGRVEAACKTVVGRRMKCTGMRWTVAGANPALWVRCARLGGWFDDYWEHRHRQAA